MKCICTKDLDDYFKINDTVIVKRQSKNNYRARKINTMGYVYKIPEYVFKSHFKTLKGA